MRKALYFAIALSLPLAQARAQAPIGPEPAAAGTAEGAKEIVDGLAAYVGRGAFDKGVLTVEPDPAGYRITIDAMPVLGPVAGSDAKISIRPYSMVVSRRADGDWNYFSNSDFDITAETTTDGTRQVIDYDIGAQLFKGVYSPSIAALLSGSGSVENLTMRARDPASEITASMDKTTVAVTGVPSGDGAANVSVVQKTGRFNETISLKSGPAMPLGTGAVTVAAANLNVATAITAVRTKALLDLYAFFVAHPEFASAETNRDKLAASQAELKTRLRNALPLWKRLDAAYDLGELSAKGEFGSFGADSMKIAFGADGVSEAGVVTYGLTINGMNVASPQIPGWTGTLIPDDIDLRFKVDGLDLETAANIALDDLDLARANPISEEAQARIAEAFATSPPRLVIEPSRIKSRDLELAMAGSFAMSAGKPALTMDVTAAGLDKAIATLQAAAENDSSILQVVGGISMAKGFGKALPDGRMQWVVDAASDGSVKVNGFEVKGPDAATVPDDAADGTLPDDEEEGIAPEGELPLDQAPTDDNALPDAPPSPQ